MGLRQRRRRKRTSAFLWYVLPAAAIIIVTIWISQTLLNRERVGEKVAGMGNVHINSPSSPHPPYNSVPPTSGYHVGGKSNWGVHDEQIQDEIQVHNLEDGGVIVHYDPEEVDDETIDALESIVRSYRDKVILEPYDGIETPLVLTAWRRIDNLDELDESRIRLFIDTYRGIDHHVR